MKEEYSEKKLEKIDRKVYKWAVKFSKSRHYETLTEKQKQQSEFVITSFTQYMYSRHGVAPEKWDEERLKRCCLYTLPEKITASYSYFKSIAPVLSAFFNFATEKRLIRNSNLASAVKEIEAQIVENASNPQNWGMAKSFFMSAKKAGIDIWNMKDLQTYRTTILQYLQLMRGNTIPHRKPKMERNAPCSCGSGKKYKKCCGR